ncbi:MAG: VWA domain-containing protein [Phycisphaerales bacterium]
MIFLSPIAGLVAGAIGGAMVLLLYMLRLRRRPLQVSSTLLWSRAVKDLEGNIPWQRLSPSLLLLLHLLVVLLLALAIARPVADDALGINDRVYLVLDTSASMSGTVDGETGFDRARRRAIERVQLLFDSGRSARVSVIEAGSEPRVVLSGSTERGRLIGAINGLEPTDEPGEIAPAIELIETLHEARRGGDGEEGSEPGETVDGEALVWVYTDGGPIDRDTLAMRGGGGVTVPVFDGDEPPRNMGIVAVGARRDRVDPILCRVFVRIERSESGPRAGIVRVMAEDQVIASSAVSFGDDADSVTRTFEIRLPMAALLRLELGAEDALESDNRAWVSVPDPSPVRVSVVAPDAVADPLLVDMLSVITRTGVPVLGVNEPIGDADLVVYDRVSPSVLPGVPTIGFGGVVPGAGSVLDDPGPRRRMISWDRADPLLQEAGVGAVSYQRSVELDTVEARVLASDREGAVIAEYARAGNRHVRVAFALHDSNWPVQYGLTVFLVNAIEQLLPGAGGEGTVYRTGEVIELPGPEGSPVAVGPFAQVGERTIPGAGGARIGVSVLNAEETAMRTRSAIPIGSGRVDASGDFTGGGRRELWRWFTLAAIVLIAMEWFVYARKVRIA